MSARAPHPVTDLAWRDLALAPRETLVALTEAPSLLLNPDVVSPVGYVPPDLEPARLRESRGGIAVTSPSLGTVRLPEHGLSGRQLAEVRRSHHVDVPRAVSTPSRLATLLGQLALAGVPVVAHPPLPLAVSRRLGPGPSSLISATTVSSLRTPGDREAASVRLRRRALRALTGLGPRLGRTRVTVVAEVRDHDEALAVLASAAAQDVAPSEVVLLSPEPLDGLRPTDPDARHRVVLGAGEEALAQCASSATGQVAELDPGLVYGPHHLSDLLLAQGYAHTEVAGVEVARTYVGELDLVAVAPGGAERHSTALTPGTTIAPARAWRDGRPTTGHAIHALGVAAVDGVTGLSRLDGTEAQEPGWASALSGLDHPPATTRPAWARGGPRPARLRSYFGRVGNVSTSRAAASLRT